MCVCTRWARHVCAQRTLPTQLMQCKCTPPETPSMRLLARTEPGRSCVTCESGENPLSSTTHAVPFAWSEQVRLCSRDSCCACRADVCHVAQMCASVPLTHGETRSWGPGREGRTQRQGRPTDGAPPDGRAAHRGGIASGRSVARAAPVSTVRPTRRRRAAAAADRRARPPWRPRATSARGRARARAAPPLGRARAQHARRRR